MIKAYTPEQLRRALGSFATGVTVVTTRCKEGKLVGLTANSFSSVSLDPPIILWSLKISSPSLSAFDQCGRFAINVLARDQVATSRLFASQQANKFEGIAHRMSANGLAILEGCVASFECRIEQRLEVGDHILFLGRVEDFNHQSGDGLLYWQGQYAQGLGLDA